MFSYIRTPFQNYNGEISSVVCPKILQGNIIIKFDAVACYLENLCCSLITMNLVSKI